MNSLLVGVGISDGAAPGDDPVADAVTAEAVGYDFVPAAGRPVRTYPTYETQTLLTWIAARTTRIGIVPRVLWAAEIPPNVRVSGHVYDVGTGLVTTVVDAKSKK